MSCIQLGEATQTYKLNNVHFTILPSFYGIPNADLLIFIRDFYATMQTFPPPQGLTKEQLRMRCFPYTLKDRAKAWLMTHPSIKFTDNMGSSVREVYKK